MTSAPCWAAIAPSNADFPPRTGAQVQPAPAVGALEGRQGQRPGDQLTALVLDQRHTVTDRGEPARVTTGQIHRVGRVTANRPVHLVGELLGGQHAGPSGQVHRRPGVVGRQCRIEFARGRPEGVGEGLRDPAGMGMDERTVPDGVGCGRRGQFGHPGRLVPPGNLAEHTVDETRSDRVEFEPSLFHCGRHRGMLGDVGAQQLVAPQPQQVQQHRVDLVDRPVGRRRDHRVEQTAGAAGAVGEFGGERGVAPADPALGQHGRQGEVGVGIALADGPQNIECGPARRIQWTARGPARTSSRRSLAGLTTGPAGAGIAFAGHRAHTPSSRRAPRAQSPAGMDFLPGG